ncbi:hypothetical protein J7L97_01580 [Candidatus Bathyarchaeota archaeon]|nr:hypothetical protein [Candidatus Bathyarchaeota archaeon]
MNIAFFEDVYYENFLPIAYTRPVYELRCSIGPLYQKISRMFPEAKEVFFTRDYLAPVFSNRVKGSAVNKVEALDDDTLFVNGCLLPSKNLKETITRNIGKNMIALQQGRVAFAYLKESLCRDLGGLFLKPIGDLEIQKIKEKVEVKEVDGLTILEYPWELFDHNGKLIIEEFDLISKGESEGYIDDGVRIYGDPKRLYVAKDASIEAGVVIDVRKGPVYIGEESFIQAPSRIDGPAYFGRDNQVFGALIREGCSFGDVCRLGGEIEETIFQGYSNKRHTGFLGHSYVGEWVNLGALTTNSDLKNDYSTVKIFIKQRLTDSGRIKLGSFISDHVKTGIGFIMNTGTVIGVMSNVIPSGEPSPKLIPSFCWYFRGKFSKGLGLSSMIETARIVKSRRGVSLTDEEVQLFHKLYELTREEREKLIKRSKLKRRF